MAHVLIVGTRRTERLVPSACTVSATFQPTLVDSWADYWAASLPRRSVRLDLRCLDETKIVESEDLPGSYIGYFLVVSDMQERAERRGLNPYYLRFNLAS